MIDALNNRVELFPKPTPLHFLESISLELNVETFLKRDDLTAIGGGGNKARKLEFIAYEAIEAGADILVTTGTAQSNHARMTAAVANRLGLGCHLILMGDDNRETIEGNRLLETILDVEVSHTTVSEASAEIEAVMEKLESSNKNPFFIEGGGHTPSGALGYIDCSTEIHHQIPNVDYIITTTGTGTTHAGLAAGIACQDLPTEVIGISIARTESKCRNEINDILTSLGDQYDNPINTEVEITVFDDYIGDGYGDFTPATKDAIKQLSKSEGIILDPIYTGKAFAGFLDLLERNYIESGSTVVFLHTGGVPGLFVSRFEKQEIWD